MQDAIEIFGRMSDDLKGAIITAVFTSIVSIIGFILTNKNMSKNLKNELKKKHISHIEDVLYCVLEKKGLYVIKK